MKKRTLFDLGLDIEINMMKIEQKLFILQASKKIMHILFTKKGG